MAFKMKVRVCERCGKEMLGTKAKRFCAACVLAKRREHDALRREARKSAKATGKVICMHCGKAFEPSGEGIVCPDCQERLKRFGRKAKWQMKQEPRPVYANMYHINELVHEAVMAGVSYGKLQAMKAGYL